MKGAPSPRDPSLWRHRDFLLWGGQTVSEIGSAVTVIALPLTAVVVLQASTFQVGVLSAMATAAFLVIALPAGTVVDRLAKRGLMVVCDTARMLIIGSVPLAAALGALTMAQLYLVALAAGVATVFFDVAYQSYLPLLVRSGQLTDGNGKLQTTAEASRVAGPGLGGVLVGLFGAAGAMAADAISYAVSLGSLLLMDRPGHPPLGGLLGSAIGIRPTLWVGVLGAWASGLWVLFSPPRGLRDVPVPAWRQPHPPGIAAGEGIAVAGEGPPVAGEGPLRMQNG